MALVRNRHFVLEKEQEQEMELELEKGSAAL